MPSSFAWLDSSEHEQRRALDVIDLLQQRETVDELGIGSVRDTIADVIAPGTSTIQTRARYFFFIPWIYQTMEERAVTGKDVAREARKREGDLIEALGQAEDSAGTIGIQSGRDVRRLPSTIYWAGLGRLGFRLYDGSKDQYHRVIGRGAVASARDDAGDVLLDAPLKGRWHPHLPSAPEGFPEKATFALTAAESKFFREQVSMHARDSLIHFLLTEEQPLQGLEFPWELPNASEMPSRLGQWVVDGQNFSELIHGAQLLYGLLLSEKRQHAEWIEDYRASCVEWVEETERRMAVYSTWDKDGFWSRLRGQNSRLPSSVQTFSQAWISLLLAKSRKSDIFDDPIARTLVASRERELKRSRARLESRPHLDLWGGGELQRLNYRWYITRTVVTDLLNGMKGD